MNARAGALRVLTACRVNGAWADAALAAELSRSGLSAADAALCARLVYGVLQNRLLLDWYLDAYCAQRLDHLQQPLPDILRLGAYQILLLDRVPDGAAVNEAVELAKASKRGAASGLVNAVLRKLAQNKEHCRSCRRMPSGGFRSRRAIRFGWRSVSFRCWARRRPKRFCGATMLSRRSRRR